MLAAHDFTTLGKFAAVIAQSSEQLLIRLPQVQAWTWLPEAAIAKSTITQTEAFAPARTRRKPRIR